jgi:hypothetical protein
MKTLVPQHILEQIKFSDLKRDEGDYPVPVGIKPQTKPCEDCGQTVTDRTVEIKLFQHPQKHWRQRCTNCNLFKNTDTHKFDLDITAAATFFRRKIKNKDK